MKYTVPADSLPDITKRLDRLSVKAAKYNKTLSYTMGAEYFYTVRVMQPFPPYGQLGQVAQYTVAAVDIDIVSDIIRADGWTVAAYLEHTDAGNIVTAIDGDVLPAWYTIPATCDHCRSNRDRMYTYIVRNTAGDYRQVGTACLRDYTGIDAALVAALVALQSEIIADDTAPEGCAPDDYSRRYNAVYSPVDVLAYAIDSISARGYIKAANPGSTRESVMTALDNGATATLAAVAQAREIAAYIASYNGVDNIIMDCRALVLSELCKPKHLGRLVYAPVAVEREKERTRAAEERAAVERVSEYVGNVGDRITLDIADCVCVTSWGNGYGGETHLYKMLDVCGNVIVWFSSNMLGTESVVTRTGKTLDGETWEQKDLQFDHFRAGKLTATIKEHSIRDGVKQTIITRGKIITA